MVFEHNDVCKLLLFIGRYLITVVLFLANSLKQNIKNNPVFCLVHRMSVLHIMITMRERGAASKAHSVSGQEHERADNTD